VNKTIRFGVSRVVSYIISIQVYIYTNSPTSLCCSFPTCSATAALVSPSVWILFPSSSRFCYFSKILGLVFLAWTCANCSGVQFFDSSGILGSLGSHSALRVLVGGSCVVSHDVWRDTDFGFVDDGLVVFPVARHDSLRGVGLVSFRVLLFRCFCSTSIFSLVSSLGSSLFAAFLSCITSSGTFFPALMAYSCLRLASIS